MIVPMFNGSTITLCQSLATLLGPMAFGCMDLCMADAWNQTWSFKTSYGWIDQVWKSSVPDVKGLFDTLSPCGSGVQCSLTETEVSGLIPCVIFFCFNASGTFLGFSLSAAFPVQKAKLINFIIFLFL